MFGFGKKMFTKDEARHLLECAGKFGVLSDKGFFSNTSDLYNRFKHNVPKLVMSADLKEVDVSLWRDVIGAYACLEGIMDLYAHNKAHENNDALQALSYAKESRNCAELLLRKMSTCTPKRFGSYEDIKSEEMKKLARTSRDAFVSRIVEIKDAYNASKPKSTEESIISHEMTEEDENKLIRNISKEAIKSIKEVYITGKEEDSSDTSATTVFELADFENTIESVINHEKVNFRKVLFVCGVLKCFKVAKFVNHYLYNNGFMTSYISPNIDYGTIEDTIRIITKRYSEDLDRILRNPDWITEIGMKDSINVIALIMHATIPRGYFSQDNLIGYEVEGLVKYMFPSIDISRRAIRAGNYFYVNESDWDEMKRAFNMTGHFLGAAVSDYENRYSHHIPEEITIVINEMTDAINEYQSEINKRIKEDSKFEEYSRIFAAENLFRVEKTGDKVKDVVTAEIDFLKYHWIPLNKRAYGSLGYFGESGVAMNLHAFVQAVIKYYFDKQLCESIDQLMIERAEREFSGASPFSEVFKFSEERADDIEHYISILEYYDGDDSDEIEVIPGINSLILTSALGRGMGTYENIDVNLMSFVHNLLILLSDKTIEELAREVSASDD